MKVHPLIAGAIISAIFAVQGWMLIKLSSLGEDMASVKTEMHMLARQQTSNHSTQ